MHTIDLTGYRLSDPQENLWLPPLDYRLDPGEVGVVESPSAGRAHLFLKGLATLAYPDDGMYRFMGETLDFSDYRHLLPIKRRIGYLGPYSALISNLSVLENLMISRNYFDNTLDHTLPGFLEAHCRKFGLEDKLDLRPALLDPLDQRTVIMLRELDKSPDLLILDFPDDLFSHQHFDRLVRHIRKRVDAGMAMVLMTECGLLLNAFSNTVFSV